MQTNESQFFREHEIEWDDTKVSRLWNYYSRTPPYSYVYFSKVFGHHLLRYSGLPLGESLEVLDFGCGPGFIWEHLNRMGSRWQYTALDFSNDSVSTVVKKAHGNKYFRGVTHVNKLPTNLPDTHFDVVLLFEVVEHLNDAYLDGTLTEIARILKKGGVCVITTPNKEDLSMSNNFCPECGAIFHKWQHIRSWDVNSLSAYLKQYGFDLCLSKTLDLTAQGLTPHALFRKVRRKAQQLLNVDSCCPHMITVFQKA